MDTNKLLLFKEHFQNQVLEHPEYPAVICKDITYTYNQINRKANQLAWKMIHNGFQKGEIAVLCVNRSAEMLIALIAVLKAGGAYVPIEPSTPVQRMSEIVKASNATVFLYDKKMPVMEGIQSMMLLDVMQESAYDTEDTNVPIESQGSDLMSILFTSGSEGVPKGVLRNNISLAAAVDIAIKEYDIDFTKNIAMICSIGFVMAYIEFLTTLTVGGCVILFTDDEKKNISMANELILKYHIHALFVTPSYFSALTTDHDATKQLLNTVKVLTFAGEALKIPEHVLAMEEAKNVIVNNMYGSTETLFISKRTFRLSDYKMGNRSIGFPLQLLDTILMEENHECGVGEPGEIMVAGIGLSHGYLDERENQNRFVTYKGKVWYRTGDIGVWCDDGSINYLERRDSQIKVHGNRIELQEIEKVLNQVPGVNKTVIIVRKSESGENEIYAYILGDTKISIDKAYEMLRYKLPSYMIPKGILQLDEIPLNVNGKIDKKRLPLIQKKREAYTKPRNQKEEILTTLFSCVLKETEVGILDNFFKIGGDSLKAMYLINLIEHEFGTRISLSDLLKHPTVASLAECITDTLCSQQIPVSEKQLIYEMSEQEKRMFLAYDSDRTSTVYNIPIVLKVQQNVEKERLKKAFQCLIQRHSILRTSFQLIEGKWMQVVAEHVEANFISYKDGREDDTIIKESIRPFVLEKASQIRLILVEKQNYYLLILDMHHIISDGRTVGILLEELCEIYNCGEQMNATRLQYCDYSNWMNARNWDSDRAYWSQKLNQHNTALSLPYDYRQPTMIGHQGNTIYLHLDDKLRRRVTQLASDIGGTEYVVLLTAFFILLRKYSLQDDIMVGTPVSGRTKAELVNMPGMFVNTVVIHGMVENEKEINVLLEEVKEEVIQVLEHQEYALENLLQEIELKRIAGRNPFFDVMFVLQNNEFFVPCLDGVPCERLKPLRDVSKFHLTLEVDNQVSGYDLAAEYSTQLFQKDTISRMLQNYVKIIEQITERPQQTIQSIEMITETEKEMIIHQFNKAYEPIDKQCVRELFLKQVYLTPDAPAIYYEENCMTYIDLYTKANQLAWILHRMGIGPNDMVPILINRGIHMMVGIYGIILAGAAYVPISLDMPEQRMNYIIQDIKPKVILTSKECNREFQNMVVLYLEDEEIYSTNEKEPVPCQNTIEDLAYVIYTSGTTGKPKGVMSLQKGIVNRIQWMQQAYPIRTGDVILQKTTFTFDVSVWELFWWGWTGASVALLKSGGEKAPNDICDAICKYHISTLHFVPSMLDIFLHYLESNPNKIQGLESLKQVFSSGEALNVATVKHFYQVFDYSKVKLINLYGPTEASVDVSYYNCKPEDDKIPIGKPIRNIKLWICNGEKLCGIGVPGELCIAGVGLSRGYVNQEELTKSVFVYHEELKDRLYHTGDLARWLPDGNIEYLGRIDHQVKIRGFRIELGEIEETLKQYYGIGECAITVIENEKGHKSLCAYLVSDQQVNFRLLKDKLRETLPEYMIPAYYMQIAQIPLTQNGKLNVKQLPPIEIMQRVEYEAPRNAVEQCLADVFSRVLNVEKVGIHDHFFELGGDSMLAMQAVTLLSEQGYSLSVQNIMQNPTIAQLMGCLVEQLL